MEVNGMSKNIVISLVVISLLLGGYLYTSNSRVTNTPDTMVKPETTQVEETEKPVDSITSKQYAPYTKEVLESSKVGRRVLFFYASWCPTCIPADADFIKNISTLPSDVTVIRVNYSDSDTDKEEKELAAKYNITYQHTYVQIGPEGQEITKWNGGSMRELLAKIK